jgi:16S rRNA (cytosine967-C5)-methyltransferase
VSLEALVVELLARAERTAAPPSASMAELFAREQLRPRQRKRVKELFFRMLAQERLIDRAVEVATPAGLAPQIAGPIRVMVGQVLAGELSVKAAQRQIGWIDWPRVAGLRSEVQAIADPVERLALTGSLPDWLARRLVEQFGAEADGLVEALTAPAPIVLRANTLRCSRDELAARLGAEGIETRPTPFASAGLEVLTAAQLFRTAAFREGWFEMQDEASQLVAEAVAPPPGGVVLDACAGAGGKTLALAALLGNRGVMLATDQDQGRLGDLRVRARRAGAHNVRALRVPADGWPPEVEAFAARADRILVDAPCTGLGSMRRNPDIRARTSQEELARLRAIQVELLARAAERLAPRARVVYATCTLLREENESVVEEVLGRVPGLERVRIVEILGGDRVRPLCDPSGTFLRTLPNRHGTDGFFAAVLRRGERG